MVRKDMAGKRIRKKKNPSCWSTKEKKQDLTEIKNLTQATFFPGLV